MKKNLFKIFSLVFVVLIFVPLLSACQSTDKVNSYIDSSAFKNAIFEYDDVKDQTKVYWTTTLTNETIYNFKSFSVKLRLYSGDSLLETETYSYGKGVQHGKSSSGRFIFTCDGNVDRVEYVEWDADYATFWETYWIWIIAVVIVAGITSLFYIVIMIVKNLELGEVFDEIGDFFSNYFLAGITLVLSAICGTISGIVLSNWVCVLIVIGGILSFIGVGLLAHFIKFLCFIILLSGFNRKDIKTNKCKSKQQKKSKETFDEKDEFESYSIAELKAYCRENSISNYSGLSKDELITLINNSSITQKNGAKTRQKKNKITFADIAGLENAKQAFKEKVVLAFEHKELYEKYGKKVGGGILLYGLPGTGKTMFAEAASNETDSLFIPIKCSDIKSKWYGESEANIKKIFNKARNAGKAIIFFDEFEAIGAKRTDNAENGNNDLVPEILAEMQGVNQKSNSVIVVIASTNKPWAIDSAFLRPGRFDEKIYIPLPDIQAREKLCELKLKNVPTHDLDYHQMAELTDGFNGADITEFCEKLKMHAIRESLTSGSEHIINMEDVNTVVKTVKSSVLEEDLVNLKEFESKF